MSSIGKEEEGDTAPDILVIKALSSIKTELFMDKCTTYHQAYHVFVVSLEKHN